VLDTLTPAERLAFVLHDTFAVPFEDIAPDRGAIARRDPPARQPALVDGIPGAAWASRGTARVAFHFTLSDRKIVAIDLVADPDRLRDVTLLDG
jgi:RNA polymerase sigma-70 factor, ECF subfamily